MRKFRQELFLVSWFGVAGFLVLLPELAYGKSETSVLVAQANGLLETDFEPIQIEGSLDSNSEKLDDGTFFDVHTFEGKVGEQIVIELDSREFDVYLILDDPQGNKIAEDDNGGNGRNARVIVTLPVTGTYKITVNTFPGELGKYSISLRTALPEDIELAEAERLYQQAIQLNLAEIYGKAIAFAEKSLAIRQRILGEDHIEVSNSLNILAFLYKSQERYEEAETLFYQILEMRKRLFGQEHYSVSISLNSLAELYKDQERYEEAETFYRQALEMNKRLFGQEHHSIATSLDNLAELYKDQGKYKAAETLYYQALEMRKQLFGLVHLHVAISFSNLAELYKDRVRYEEAETLYRQALEINKQLFGLKHPRVAHSLTSLGWLYWNQGRYEEAEPLYQQALEVNKQLFGLEHPDVATSLHNLAFLYNSQGRYAEAETIFHQALEMRKRLLGEEHSRVAISLGTLAQLYWNQGKYEEAETLYQQALEMIKQFFGEEHSYVAISLNELATLYSNQGRYAEAELLSRQALEIMKRTLGREHPYVATGLNNVAELYQDQGRYKEAEPLYHQALEMMKRTLGQEHPNVATNLENLARLYWNQNKTSLAIENLTQALAIEETNLVYNAFAGFERQKRNYLEKTELAATNDVNLSLHLNSAPNDPQAANLGFDTILQRKGRVLSFFSSSLQNLHQSSEPEDKKLLNELTAAYRQLANLIYNRPEKLQLKQYKNRVASLEEKVGELEGKLSKRSKDFLQKFQTPSINSIQEILPADNVLVEFAKYRPYNPKANGSGKPHYAAYILTPQGEPQGIDLGEAETIEEAITLFQEDISDPETPKEQLQESARNLDKLVMEPVRKLLGDSKHILLAPQAALNLIPFEALVDEEERFLVENYAFTYLTSGRDLLKLTNSNPSQEPPLILANPNFEVPAEIAVGEEVEQLVSSINTRSIDLSQTRFPSLLGTKDEGEAIGEKLGVTPLMNRQATEAAIKNSNSPKILHIATHGFFKSSFKSDLEEQTYQDNPLLLSGLVLAGFRKEQSGSNEDGILTAQEVSALDLVGTKLVVLSACDTGLGELDAGEGLYSLRRALVIAGAESQLISLWKVEDNATKELMIAYYDKLLANQGRSEALRQTQLEMLKGEEYAHPYYWAAFIPSGNWKEMN
ncbi:MAG: tetratricopeptide repeat protein [Symploca sp. SIO1B1]|nr:tetratricopeptide repeat protein [Symploca sp. SIO1B1]